MAVTVFGQRPVDAVPRQGRRGNDRNQQGAYRGQEGQVEQEPDRIPKQACQCGPYGLSGSLIAVQRVAGLGHLFQEFIVACVGIGGYGHLIVEPAVEGHAHCDSAIQDIGLQIAGGGIQQEVQEEESQDNEEQPAQGLMGLHGTEDDGRYIELR